jgi:hypothetical protein
MQTRTGIANRAFRLDRSEIRYHAGSMWKPLTALILFLLSLPAMAQIEPGSAHVNLYFPQLADGGTATQRWQTRFEFFNPHESLSAAVILTILDSNGRLMPVDFGSGPTARVTFTLPPRGSRTLRTTGNSPITVTGWAYGNASLPVQATLLFRAIEQGLPRVDISAPAVLPGLTYWAIANPDLGIAVANPYGDSSITVRATAIDQNGTAAGSNTLLLPPAGQRAFNLRNLLPSLPTAFRGTVRLESVDGRAYFVAWSLNASDNLLSSLPDGTAPWPVSHYDRIWLAYSKILNGAQSVFGPGLGINLLNPLVDLRIDGSPEINAFASGGNWIQVNLALSQLISDSPSELAFVIGHEIGHIIQARTGRRVIDATNAELDADGWGVLLNLVAGYDPYAGAGSLAKLSMATGSAGLVSQVLQDHFGVHRSMNTRMSEMYQLLRIVCEIPEMTGFCAEYKRIIHPNFPPSAPLAAPQTPTVRIDQHFMGAGEARTPATPR